MKKSIFLSPASCAVALALFIGCNGKKVSKNNVADLKSIEKLQVKLYCLSNEDR